MQLTEFEESKCGIVLIKMRFWVIEAPFPFNGYLNSSMPLRYVVIKVPVLNQKY